MRPVASPPPIQLSPGQSLHLAVQAGTVVLACDGRLRIDEAPQWLAERCVRTSHSLAPGEHQLLMRAGWICITAMDETQGTGVRLVAPQPSSEPGLQRPPLWQAMRRLAGF